MWILDVDAGAHGASDDTTIFFDSDVGARFREGDFEGYFLVAGSEYDHYDYLCTPLYEKAELTAPEAAYNK